jgi:predicted secreted hydrolase
LGFLCGFLLALNLAVAGSPAAGLQAAPPAESFEIPRPGRAFRFPRDHGSHPEFKTEWWYYSGHLESAAGEHFGYQLTFFRTALRRPDPRARSAWSLHTVYFAHLALSDQARGRFLFREKASRGTLGLAGAGTGALEVWIDSWRAETAGDRHLLKAQDDGLALDLELTPSKPPALHGEGGYSRKSDRSGAASFYYSLPRLATSGRLTLEGREHAVTGQSWMDHEFFTSALAPGLTGWDWFALQLDDGQEVMLYLLRHRDGSVDPASSGSLIDLQGQVRHLNLADFRVKASGFWKSAASGASYPGGWEIAIPGAGYRLTLTPVLSDQEIRAAAPPVTYWEGEVNVKGWKAGEAVAGKGFVELTGYAGIMGSRF